MMKIVVTNVFGPLNRGDHELFKILLQEIQKYPVEISAIARDPELCTKYFPQVTFYEQLGKYTYGRASQQIFGRLIYLLLCLLIVYVPAVSFLLPSSQRQAVQAIQYADFVIACPGGFLEDSSFSLYSHLVQLLLPILFGRKVILAPMSIGPVKNKFSRRILKYILNRVDRVYVREVISQEFCNSLGVNCQLSNDLAFLTLINDEEQSNSKESKVLYDYNYIAATVINWNFPNATNSQKSRELYIKNMVLTLNNLHKQTSLPVKLIVQVEKDLPAIEAVKANLSVPCEIVYHITTPELIKDFLNKSFCLVASRFHSAIFSLSVGCPVIALGYLPKTLGMLKLYNLEELYRPIDNFEPDELSSKLMEIGTNRKKFASMVEQMTYKLKLIGNPFLDYLEDNFNMYKSN